MISAPFERALNRLVRAFGHYHDVERGPDNLESIVEARFELEDARSEARSAREVEPSAASAPNHPIARADVSPEDRARLGVLGIGTVGEG